MLSELGKESMGMRGTERHRAQRARAIYDAAQDGRGYPQYSDQYPEYPGHPLDTTQQQAVYRSAARQPLAQVRAQIAPRELHATAFDPSRSGERYGSRAYRAWQEGQLAGGSDVSLPRIRVAGGPRGFTAAPQVGAWPDAYPDELPPDSYDIPTVARVTPLRGAATAVRERTTARPVTREQRATVIEHPWADQVDVDESGMDESGVREFSRELDALISVTTAQQRVVLPKATPAPGKHKVPRLGVAAALGVRLGLVFLILFGIMTGITALTGHPPIPLPNLPLLGLTEAGADLHLGVDANLLTRIRPLTQLKRSDQYDSSAQFNAWGGAACSAAVLAEILTAYGVEHATIGRMIDELGSNISSQWGLVSYDGFAKVAAKYGLRADMYVDHPLSYTQMLYITNTLHIPLIVNVRATSGYYHYLSGGHFLVMTGGDAQTVRLVDSSEYYIKSLPIATFMGMYRNRSVAIVPKDFQYKLP